MTVQANASNDTISLADLHETTLESLDLGQIAMVSGISDVLNKMGNDFQNGAAAGIIVGGAFGAAAGGIPSAGMGALPDAFDVPGGEVISGIGGTIWATRPRNQG